MAQCLEVDWHLGSPIWAYDGEAVRCRSSNRGRLRVPVYDWRPGWTWTRLRSSGDLNLLRELFAVSYAVDRWSSFRNVVLSNS
jgi:hypothetical protein